MTKALPATGDAPAGFVLRGSRGWLRGWVSSPADAVIETGGTLSVHTATGTAHRLSIVLAVGQGELPRTVPAAP